MNVDALIHHPAQLLWPLFWAVVTVTAYVLAKAFYLRVRSPWATPLITAPLTLLGLALLLHANYHDYLRGTHWLMAMLGPATVAFAVPIHQQRQVIARHWKVLGAGVLVGSGTAIIAAWLMATALHLSPELRLSLAPRSLTTPFAMDVSGRIGGIPGLTAVFVIITGICGSLFGQILLKLLPVRSAMARGALFGMGAHGMGVAKARELGESEGAIAGLVMVMAGLLNVAAAPLLALLL
jgi:predicted murein hydrolase (TIGR00659 family)